MASPPEPFSPAVGGAVGSAAGGATRSGSKTPLSQRLQNEERQEIISSIEESGGNIAAASRALGLNRSTLYYRLRKHGLSHLLPTRS